MRAVKGNKEYAINESQKASYAAEGYDILDEGGEIISYGRGKVIPYEEYHAAVKEIGRLQSYIAELKESVPGQNPELDEKTKAENKKPLKKAGE